MKHTPGPWKVKLNLEDGFNIARIWELPNSQANAEFIVRACNSHDDLLEACKYAFKNLKPQGNIKKDFSGHNAMATLSRAIAKATKE